MATIGTKAHDSEFLSADLNTASEKRYTCDEIGNAVDSGSVGDIVAKHQKLILQYYEDVQYQAKQSFSAAKAAARIGFKVLIGTLLYTLLTDLIGRMPVIHGFQMRPPSLRALTMGAISAALIEFIAGVHFVLYAKAAKQFGAFHICLERTNRYLLAYKIASELGEKKAEVLENVACIMANAPMITQHDIYGTESAGASGVSAVFKTTPPVA